MWKLANSLLLNPDGPGSPSGGGGGGSGSGAAGGIPSAGGGTGSPSGGGGAASFSPPAGSRVVSDADWNAREAAYAAFNEAGFKSADEFKAFRPVIDGVRTGGHDINTLAGILGRKGAAPKDPAAGQPPAETPDFNKMFDEKMTARERASAETGYQKYVGEKLPTITKSLATKLLGEKADETMAKIVNPFINQSIYEARIRNAYPAGHPLAGMPGELSDADVAVIETEAKGILESIKGMNMKAIGAAANRAVPGATAGTGGAGGQGAPQARDPRGQYTKAETLEIVRNARLKVEASMPGATTG